MAIYKDNDAVAIRQEEAAEAVGKPFDVFRRDAWHAFQNFLLELVVEIHRSNWPSAWMVEGQDITKRCSKDKDAVPVRKLHLDAWHALETQVRKANHQIHHAVVQVLFDLVDKDSKDNDAVAIRKEAAVAVVGLLDVFHLGAWHAVELELAVD